MLILLKHWDIHFETNYCCDRYPILMSIAGCCQILLNALKNTIILEHCSILRLEHLQDLYIIANNVAQNNTALSKASHGMRVSRVALQTFLYVQ